MTSHQPGSEHANTRPLALLIALALMALVLVVVVWDLQPPTPRGPDAPPNEFSAGRALAVLRDLLAPIGSAPHPAGSANNDQVRERIVSRLQALGYEVNIQDTVVSRSGSGALARSAPIKNIVTRLPGQTSGPAVMLVAHYDSAKAGPGAADDTSNVAAILEIARILKEHGPYRNPIILLITDGEEIGLLGAKGFADEHPWMKDVGVVVNLEARGTTGLSLMFETSENNAWLIEAYAASVPRPATNSLSYEIYKLLPNDTDLTIFKGAGKAGLNFSFIQNSQYYHTSLDDLDHLDPGSVQHQGDCVLAVTRRLADLDLSNPPAGNAAYMTLPPGLLLIRWPMAWTLPLAVLALLLLVAAAGVLVARRRLSVGALLLGLLAALLTVVLPILLGLVLTWLISTVAGVSNPWFAYPLPTRLSLWAGALLCGGLVTIGLARWAGAWGLGLGAWLLWAILGIVVSVALPGAAILLIVPTLCAALLILVVAILRPSSPLGREIIFTVAALFAGLIWVQLALLMEYAVSLAMSPVVTLPAGLVICALLPLFALPRERTRVRTLLTIAAAAVTVVAAVVAVFVPTYTDFSPQPLSLYHVEDRDAGKAYWTVYPYKGSVTGALRQRFDPEPLAVLPWSSRAYPVVRASATPDPAPDLPVLSSEQIAGERVVKVQLRSPRGADIIELLVPMAYLTSVTVAGQTLPVSPADAGNGYYDLECHGRSCDRLEVTLRFKDTEPVEVLVMDFSPGLPPGGEDLVRARSATAVPAYDGDLTMIVRRVRL